MRKKVLLFLIIWITSFVFFYLFQSREKPVLLLENDYELYQNIYQSKENTVYLIRTKEIDSDEIHYFLETDDDYYLSLDGIKYQEPSPKEVIFPEEYKNSFLEIEIYDHDDQLVDTYHFYYASDYQDLQVLDWHKYGFDYSFIIISTIILAIIFAQLIISRYFNKKEQKEDVGRNLWDRFKKASLLNKVFYLFIFLIYLILPFPFVIIGSIFLLILILILGIGFQKRIISLACTLLSLIVGASCLFVLYVIFVPEARIDYGYQEPQIELSSDGKENYQELIDDAMFYTKEPIVYYEGDFGFIMLRSYLEWTYTSSSEKMEVIYLYRVYNISKNEKKNLLIMIMREGVPVKVIDYSKNGDIREEISFDGVEEGVLTLEIRNRDDNSLIYQSEEFDLKRDFDTLDEGFYLGGQYIENEGKVYLLFVLFTHLGMVIAGSLIYLFREKIFVFRKLQINQNHKEVNNGYH